MSASTSKKDKPIVVCVFCGSVEGNNPVHSQAAKDLARAFHEQNVQLVYGGGTKGLMGQIARELVRLSGPQAVHGIIPKALVKVEPGYNQPPPSGSGAAGGGAETQTQTQTKSQEGVGKTHERVIIADKRTEVNQDEFGITTIVPDMHTRKRLMAEKVLQGGPGSGFVAMAGGFGTIEEVMEMTTWNQLGIHNVGVILLNPGGYWDGLLQWIRTAVKEGFISQANADILVDVHEVKDVLPKLRDYRASVDRFQLTWGEE